MPTALEEVKLQMAQANRLLADVGLATGGASALRHASMRVPSQLGRFVVKGRQYTLDALAVMHAEVLQGRALQRDGIWNYRVSRVSRDL